jgi:Na+-translocating ferredoxin:NAD+ oxidoreductase subunit A
MSSLLLVLLSAVLVNLVAVTSGPPWRPFVAAAGTFAAARVLAIVSLVVVPLVASLGWLLSALVLEPLDAGYLRTLAFAAIVLTIVPLAEGGVRRHGGLLPQRPAFTLLMIANAAVLGVALIVAGRALTLFDALLFSLRASAAFAVLLLAFAAMYERLRNADIPAAFREAPLALITAGIAALAFMGFTGLVQE